MPQNRDSRPSPLLGRSPAAASLRDFIARAGTVDAPVLLTGESGTGKGLVARAIHAASPRAAAPFVASNCAGVPDALFESEFFGHVRGAFTGAQYAHRGLLEQAGAGTLFLDEIGELPLPQQAKLLTVLEDREFRRVGGERVIGVAARFIAATGVHLASAVEQRTFRLDLFHRLLVLACHIPPLRDRDGDVLLLADHFLATAARRHRRPAARFHPDARRFLAAQPWPGNVRQLAHTVEAAVLACDGDTIATSHLHAFGPVPVPTAPLLHPASDRPLPPRRYSFFGSTDQERSFITAALREHRGNRSRTASALGMSRNTLRLRIRALGIEE
jgi:DNA-binding NtrC family response regulator